MYLQKDYMPDILLCKIGDCLYEQTINTQTISRCWPRRN